MTTSPFRRSGRSRRWPASSRSAHLTLRKGIPVGGGLAGGSADAAAALVAADAMWQCGFERAVLEGLAAGLGSDVAFLLHGGTALGTGSRRDRVAGPEPR